MNLRFSVLVVVLAAIGGACSEDGSGPPATDTSVGDVADSGIADTGIDAADDAERSDAGEDGGDSDGELGDSGADTRIDVTGDASDAGFDAPDFGTEEPPSAEDDPDRDDDGVDDDFDALPDDPSEIYDDDGDGEGNYAQVDEDGDGVADAEDAAPFDPSIGAWEMLTDLEPNERIDEVAQLAPMDLPARVTLTLTPPVDVEWLNFDRPANTWVSAVVTCDWPGAGADVELRREAPSETEETRFTFDFVEEPFASPLESLAATRVAPAEEGLTQFMIGLTLTQGIDGETGSCTLSVFADADGDGLDDAQERAAGLMPTRLDTDRDGLPDPHDWWPNDVDADADGLPNWLDADADGDGVPDGVEPWGDVDGDGRIAAFDTDSDGEGTPDSTFATARWLDTDDDGVPDPYDMDDDGDGLHDVDDDSPREPLPHFDWFAPDAPRVFGVDTVLEDAIVSGVVVAGLEVELFGDNLADGYPVVEANGALVTPAFTTSERGVRFTWPVGGAGVAFVSDDGRTGRLFPEQLSPSAPLIAWDPEPLSDVEFYDITGRHLEFASLSAGGQRLIPSGDPANPTVSFNTANGPLVAEIAGVRGNVVETTVWTTRQFVVRPPDGAVFSAEELVVEALANTVSTPSGGGTNVGVASDRPTLVDARVGEDGPIVLMRLFTPGTTGPLNTESTAIANIAQILAWRFDSYAEWDDVFFAIYRLPEVSALITELERGLAERVDFLSSPDEAYLEALVAAAQAASIAVEGLPDVFPKRGLVEPEEELFDIRVRLDGAGNATILNDTRLFLSAELRRTLTDAVMISHVEHGWDTRMIGGEYGVFRGFWSPLVELDLPRERNAILEIITPGLRDPAPDIDDPAQRIARDAVVIRTIVDGLIVPILNTGVGLGGSDRAALVTQIVTNLYQGINDIRSDAAGGSTLDFVKSLLNFVARDLEEGGPILLGIARVLGREAAERAARYSVPILGQVLGVVDAIATLGTAVSTVSLVADLFTTPGIVTWELDFGPEVAGIEPSRLMRRHRAQSLTIIGEGLDVGRIRITDLRAGFESYAIDVPANSDGTRVAFTIDAETMARAIGPLEIRYTQPDINQTYLVPVDWALRLDRIGPDGAAAGQELTLGGVGFEDDLDRVQIAWRDGADPDSEPLLVLPTSATATRLTVPARNETSSGEPWLVSVLVDGEESNALEWRPELPDLSGAWTISEAGIGCASAFDCATCGAYSRSWRASFDLVNEGDPSYLVGSYYAEGHWGGTSCNGGTLGYDALASSETFGQWLFESCISDFGGCPGSGPGGFKCTLGGGGEVLQCVQQWDTCFQAICAGGPPRWLTFTRR